MTDRITSRGMVLLSLVLVACCRTAPLPSVRPDPSGLEAQRALIAEWFAGLNAQAVPLSGAAFQPDGKEAVSAAWWGFDPEDATSSLQSSLDSGARVVLVPAMGTPWVTEPLSVRSHTTIILQEGVEIASRRGAFRNRQDSLLRMKDVQDVTIWGYGARLAMRKDDYRRQPYEKSEWRNTIAMFGCSDIRVLGLTAESSGGDGVYLGRGNEQSFNRNVLLKDLTLRNHFRQGISVISAEDLLIENVEMAFTEGTLPSAGIDFEPNHADERIVRCLLKNCVIRSNRGAGISLVLTKMDETSADIDIRVEDSYVADNLFSVMVWGARKVGGTLAFARTTLRGLRIIGPGQRLRITHN